jgi:hypothetical protein
MGFRHRDGHIEAKIVPNTQRRTLHSEIEARIERARRSIPTTTAPTRASRECLETPRVGGSLIGDSPARNLPSCLLGSTPH